jgi:hypothetical protein
VEVLVYTAIIGGCDTLKRAPAGVRCVCFTDDSRLRGLGWEMCVPPSSNDSPRLQSRKLRCQPNLIFPGVDAFVWLDASCEFKDFARVIADVGASEFAALPHPDRSSCLAESEVCVQLGYRTRAVHQAQMAEFRAAGYHFRGLTAGHLTWRRNTERVARFGELWLDQIMKYGSRDQCSLDFCAWRAGLEVARLTGTYRNNPYFYYDLRDHRRRRRGGA